MAYKQGLFGASFRSSIRSNVDITNLLRLRLEVMSIKMCIFRASQNKRAAHELGNNSKTLGGVQINKRGCTLAAPLKAILALQTSSDWAQPLPPRPISSERGL